MRRRLLLALLAVALLVSVLVVAAGLRRREIAVWAVRSALARAGFPDASLVIERVDLGAIEAISVFARDGFRAERIEVVLDWGKLPGAPVGRVRIVGAEVDLSLAKAAEPPPAALEPAGAFPFGLVPVLELEQAVIRVPTAAGPIEIRLDSRVEPAPGAVSTKWSAEIQGGGGRGTVRGEARLDETGAVTMTVDVKPLRIEQPGLAIPAGSLRGRFGAQVKGLDLEGAQGTIEVALTGVTSEAVKRKKIGKIEATLPVTIQRRDAAYVVHVKGAKGKLADQGVELLDVSANASATGAAARLGRVRVLDLVPLASTYGPSAGTVEASAQGRWRPGKPLAGSASVTFDGASIGPPGVQLDGLSGRVAFSSFTPLATDGMQTIRAARIFPGVALTDAEARFALEPVAGASTTHATAGSRLSIARFETAFAGGKILVENAVLDPTAERNDVVFRLAEVDVGELFGLAGLTGVAGGGRLTGELPVSVSGGRVAVHGGKLEARGGTLQMRSASITQLLAGQGESVDLLLDALSDFHYESLVLAIEKALEGEATIALHLDGANPAVLDGQPFRININLTGNVDRLISSLLEVARLSDQAMRATVRAAR